jgi:hypothetical protein
MVAMTVIAILLVLFVAGLGAYMIRKGSEPHTPPNVDPEQAMKAAIELHKIRSHLDVAWTKSEQRREGAGLRREIAEALDDDDRLP